MEGNLIITRQDDKSSHYKEIIEGVFFCNMEDVKEYVLKDIDELNFISANWEFDNGSTFEI